MRVRLNGTAAILMAACLSTIPHPVSASTATNSYVQGDLKDITSVQGGLMIRMDDDKTPLECSGSGSSWLKIDQKETAMVSLILSYWLQGKKRFTMYSATYSGGYCVISQADPEG